MQASKYFNDAYHEILTEVMEADCIELNARTGARIRMMNGPHSFKLDLTKDHSLPVAGNRKYYPHISAAEVAWQFMGTKDPTFILQHAPKLWEKFVEDGELKTAYGWRWQHAFGRNQLWLAIDELKNNPTNRQLWVQAWDPAKDGLGGHQPKNIPCPLGFAISREANLLHMSVFIRSSDLFVGLPYDVMAYALTLDAIAATVGATAGFIHFTLHHPHLYETHWDAAEACLKKDFLAKHGKDAKIYENASFIWKVSHQPRLPGWDIQTILDDPEAYVRAVQQLSRLVDDHPWKYGPEVVV